MNTIQDFAATLAPKIVDNDRGRKFFAPGPVLQQKLTSSDTGGQFSFHYSEVQPGFGPPMHIHSLEDEVFYVLEGQIQFTVGNEIVMATAGTTVFAPRGVKHTFKGLGETTSKMLGIATGSKLERFYAGFETAMASAAPDIAAIRRVAEEHGITLVAE